MEGIGSENLDENQDENFEDNIFPNNIENPSDLQGNHKATVMDVELENNEENPILGNSMGVNVAGLSGDVSEAILEEATTQLANSRSMDNNAQPQSQAVRTQAKGFLYAHIT